jgi:hypothetical protein
MVLMANPNAVAHKTKHENNSLLRRAKGGQLQGAARSFDSAFPGNNANTNPLCQIEHRVERSRVPDQAA